MEGPEQKRGALRQRAVWMPTHHSPISVLTGWVLRPFGEKMVLAACPLADAGAAQPDAASC